MIFMGMGNDQPIKPVFAIGDELRVGHLNFGTMTFQRFAINIGRRFKGQPTIDHEPASIMAIKVEVHTNFTCSPQWQEPKIFCIRRHMETSLFKNGLYYAIKTVIRSP